MSATAFNDGIREELLANARSLRPLLLRSAPKSEREGKLTDEVLGELGKFRFWDMAVPRRWGGLGVSCNTLANVVAELAKGCPSTGWTTCILGSGAWFVSTLGDPIQEEIFRGGIPRVCTLGYPQGLARKVSGGYVVRGSWGYATGSRHAQWACVAVAMEGEPGIFGCAVIPMSEMQIENTWKAAGMSATGSDTLVAKDVFVPTSRIELIPKDNKLKPDEPVRLARKNFGEPSDFWPVTPLLRSKALGVLLGSVEGLLDQVTRNAGERPIVHSIYAKKTDSQVYRAQIGEAAAQVQSARALMDHSTSLLDSTALEGRAPSVRERAANRAQVAVTVDLLTRATEGLLRAGGSSIFLETAPAQRFWRDFNVGASHPSLLPEIGYEVLGSELLGLPNIYPPEYI